LEKTGDFFHDHIGVFCNKIQKSKFFVPELPSSIPADNTSNHNHSNMSCENIPEESEEKNIKLPTENAVSKIQFL
jgi:hypothetical protein